MTNAIASIFIVPNVCDSIKLNDINLKHWNARLETFGLPPFKEGDIPIQIWITDEASENWQDHGTPAWVLESAEIDTKRDNFPTCIPSHLLAGIEEGDIFALRLKNGFSLRLKAAQLAFRYRNHGRFEEVFSKVYSR